MRPHYTTHLCRDLPPVCPRAMRTRAAAIRRFIQPQAYPSTVDALTHALIASMVCLALGMPALVPFVILGTVIPDADILYGRLFAGNPRFYLLTHGGCAHSITGAIGISLLAVAGVQLAGLCGILPPGIPVATLVPAVLAGAILHIATDALAFPGIPLLFPFSDRKITLGILPGPSFFLFGVSAILLLATMLGTVTFPAALWIEAAVITAFLACRAAGYFAVRRRWPGMLVVPTPSPFRFFVIGESGTAYTIRRVSLAGGSSGMEIFEKYTGTDRPGTENLRDLPEVRQSEVPFLWGRGGENPVRVYLFRSVPREGVFPVSSPSYPGCHSCRSRHLPGVTSPADRCFGRVSGPQFSGIDEARVPCR